MIESEKIRKVYKRLNADLHNDSLKTEKNLKKDSRREGKKR